MYKFWYDYVKPKYKQKTNLCYVDTHNFIVYTKAEDIYAEIAKDVEARFDNSDYELDRPLPKGSNKKTIRLMKDELGGKTMKKFAVLRAKTQIYLTDNNNGDIKKAKDTKKCVIKRKLKFKDYKNCLKATQLGNKINQLEQNKVNTERF